MHADSEGMIYIIMRGHVSAHLPRPATYHPTEFIRTICGVDIIVHICQAAAVEPSSWVAGRHRREQVGTLETFPIPLSDLRISDSVKSLLEEYPGPSMSDQSRNGIKLDTIGWRTSAGRRYVVLRRQLVVLLACR